MGLVFSMWFVDKNVLEHPFVQLVTIDDFKLMLIMYEMENEVTIYVTKDDDNDTIAHRDQVDVVDEVQEFNMGEKSEYCLSGESYHSRYKGRRWEVLLDEQQCTCRVWQVKGLPCYHAAAFIAFKRDNRDGYVDPYFTIDKYKVAYALEIAPMPAKDQWVRINSEEKIYPPNIKRPSGRPRKNRIKAHDESKKRHRCSRCGGYGHHGKTCKKSASHEN